MNRPEPPLSDPWHQVLAGAGIGTLAVALPTPRQRVSQHLIRHLLEEAAAQGGGRAVALPGVELLLGVTGGVARRVVLVLTDLLGVAPVLHALPEEATALRDWVANCPLPKVEEPSLATALHARLLLDATGQPRGQFLGPADATAGPTLREALCRRLMAALADPAQRQMLPVLRPGLRLFLACPSEHIAAQGPRGRRQDDAAAPVAVLPLAALVPPRDFAAQADALREAGWQPGLSGDDPAALDWMPAGAVWHVAPPGPTPPSTLHEHLLLLGERPDWAPPHALHAA